MKAMAYKAANKPDISVCIANYNGAGYVRECLESVFMQEGDFTFEVLLHDDCSTDNSVQIVREKFPNVIVLTSDMNVGFCVSNNRMVERASGRYVLLLNNDATLRPGSLMRLLKFAESGHATDILGLPQCVNGGGGNPMDHGYRTDPFLNPIPVTESNTHEVAVATGACLWIPKTTWSEIGGFPPWFESIAEDIYLCMAARLLGHRVIVLDRPSFDHRVGMNLGGGKLVSQRLVTTVRRRALSERNRTFAMLLCYPSLLLMATLPIHVISICVEAMFLLVRGIGFKRVIRIYATIPGACWGLRREIGQLRTYLKSRRCCPLRQFGSQMRWVPQKWVMLRRHGMPILR